MNLTEVAGKIEKVYTFDLAKLPVGTIFMVGNGFPRPNLPVVLLSVTNRRDSEGGQDINFGYLFPTILDKHQQVLHMDAEGPFIVNVTDRVPVLSETRDTYYWVIKDLPWYLEQVANLAKPEEHHLQK